jgi:small subunit ribosomal protein S5
MNDQTNSNPRSSRPPRGRNNRNEQSDKDKDPFVENVLQISRVSRTVKGGRRIRFRALVVVGDKAGKVGVALGKANEVSSAVTKASTKARKNMKTITIVNETIALPITSHYGSATVLLKPAPAGTSIIAGGAVRAVVEAAGIKNLVSKILGSGNKCNNAFATLAALEEATKLSTRVRK